MCIGMIQKLFEVEDRTCGETENKTANKPAFLDGRIRTGGQGEAQEIKLDKI